MGGQYVTLQQGMVTGRLPYVRSQCSVLHGSLSVDVFGQMCASALPRSKFSAWRISEVVSLWKLDYEWEHGYKNIVSTSG